MLFHKDVDMMYASSPQSFSSSSSFSVKGFSMDGIEWKALGGRFAWYRPPGKRPRTTTRTRRIGEMRVRLDRNPEPIVGNQDHRPWQCISCFLQDRLFIAAQLRREVGQQKFSDFAGFKKAKEFAWREMR
jgi:hypothetical protein